MSSTEFLGCPFDSLPAKKISLTDYQGDEKTAACLINALNSLYESTEVKHGWGSIWSGFKGKLFSNAYKHAVEKFGVAKGKTQTDFSAEQQLWILMKYAKDNPHSHTATCITALKEDLQNTAGQSRRPV